MAFWKNWFSSTSDTTGPQMTSPVGPVAINDNIALQVSAVWACVRLLTETIASLPLNVYETTTDGRKVANTQLQFLLHDQPNSRMTAVEFRETMMLNLVLYGNAYAHVDRAADGRVVSIWPLSTPQMDVETLKDGSIVYTYQKTNVTVIAPENIIHIKLFGNGVLGLSPLSYARNAIGLAVSSEKYSNNFFKNGGKPSGILTIDRTLKPEQRKLIQQNFKDLSEGEANVHSMMVLESGMTYSPIQINPENMQMLQTRRFQIEDIARFFGVPSVLINENSVTTTLGSSVEQIIRTFHILTIRPYLVRIEQALWKSLLTPTERRKYIIEFNFEGLLRTDSKTRAEMYSTMVQNGLMTRNEVRKKENLPLVDSGDDLTAQLNLAPLDRLGVREFKPIGNEK